MTAPRILVLDGNVAEIRARLCAIVGYDTGTGYARVLRRIEPSLHIDIVTAADGDAKLPAGAGLDSYDGVTMTGSALNIYNGGAAVARQIEMAKAVFAAGVPFFGSCWGLQVAVTAAGGEVDALDQTAHEWAAGALTTGAGAGPFTPRRSIVKMRWRVNRSILRSRSRSVPSQSEIALPSWPARAVRPIRCT